MSMIRTTTVELSSIPAIAYKQKLPKGGTGLKLLRLDQDARAAYTLDRRTGGAVPYGNHKTDTAIFPDEAINEALELLGGLPYGKRGNISINVESWEPDVEAAQQEEPQLPDMTESNEYKAILATYTGLNGKLDYTRMNKEFIQFASKSKLVSKLVSERAPTDEIMVHIVKSRATELSGGKQSLDDAQVQALIDTLDDINPRSAFKELKKHVNIMLGKAK